MGKQPAYWAATWVIMVHWEQHVTLCYNAAKQPVLRVSRKKNKNERKKKAGAKNQTTNPKVGGIERRLSA